MAGDGKLRGFQLSQTESPALLGDVTGTMVAAVVAKIRGNDVLAGVPNDGEVLTWDNGNSRWAAAPATAASWESIYNNDKNLNITSGDMEFITPVAGGANDFVVREDAGSPPAEFIRCDASVSQLFLGDDDGTGVDVFVEGRISSDITFDGSAHQLGNSDDLHWFVDGASIFQTSGTTTIRNVGGSVLFWVSNSATGSLALASGVAQNVSITPGSGGSFAIAPGVSPTAPLDVATITATSGGLDNEALQGLVVNMTSNVGDLNTAPINGIQLNVADPGGSSETRAIDIGADWNFGLKTASPAQFDSTTTHSGHVTLNGGIYLVLGTSGSGLLGFSNVQTPDNLMLGVGSTGRALVVCEYTDRNFDFAHPQQTDPTIFIQSSDTTDRGEFLGLSYLGLQAGTMSTDRATYDLTIKASSAFASATGGNRNAGNLILEGGTGQAATFDGIVQVGSGFTTSHSFDSENDLGVLGKLEVDGIAYFDALVRLGIQNDFMTANGGSTPALRMRYQIDDGFHFSMNVTEGQGNNHLILTTVANAAKDHDHDVASTNPTFIVHSATDPDTDFGEFLGLSYLGLQAGTMETDRSTYDMTFQAASAYSLATGGNITGGDLVLRAGTGKAAADDGSLLIKQPTGGATLGTYFPDGRLYMDSSPASNQGTIIATNDGVTASDSVLMALGDGTIAGIGTTTVFRFTVDLAGNTDIVADTTSAALRVEQAATASGGPILRLIDGNASVTRLEVDQDGLIDVEANSSTAALRVGQQGSGTIFGAYDGGPGTGTLRAEVTKGGRFSVITSATLASEAMIIDQNDTDQPFIDFQGLESANQTDSISTSPGAGSVVGPKDQAAAEEAWAFDSMIKIEINGATHWLAAYTAV